MIFTAFFKVLGQLNDPKFLRVVLIALGITIALLAGLTWGLVWVLPDTIWLPLIGEVEWLSKALSGFIVVAMFWLSTVLMVPVASLFAGFFLEQVADAVEAKHYPSLPSADQARFMDILIDSLKFFGLLVVVNLVALIIYLLSTLLAPVVFWIVNGILLGREYFQLVAMRHLGRKGANALRAKHRLTIWFAGFLMAVPLSIPLLNLFIPLIGVAVFTHMFHALNTSAASEA